MGAKGRHKGPSIHTHIPLVRPPRFWPSVATVFKMQLKTYVRVGEISVLPWDFGVKNAHIRLRVTLFPFVLGLSSLKPASEMANSASLVAELYNR